MEVYSILLISACHITRIDNWVSYRSAVVVVVVACVCVCGGGGGEAPLPTFFGIFLFWAGKIFKINP